MFRQILLTLDFTWYANFFSSSKNWQLLFLLAASSIANDNSLLNNFQIYQDLKIAIKI